jgi:GT2 family glycosyltransferase
MPTVTIAITSYERPDTIATAISRALSQTFGDFEVLIGDDSSSESVRQVVSHFRDPRVRYVRHAVRKGPLANWVGLILDSRTEFVAFLADDDFWEPDFLRRVLSPMQENRRIGMSFCDAWYVDALGRRLIDETERRSRVTHRDRLPDGVLNMTDEQALRMIAVHNAPQSAYAACMRRDLVAKIDFPTQVAPAHDLWCTYRLWRQGGFRFHYMPERLVNYRLHDGNLGTAANLAKAEDFIFSAIARENPANCAVIELQRRWAVIRFSRATRLLREGTTHLAEAQREMAAAAPALQGWRQVVARSFVNAPSVGVALSMVQRFRFARPRITTSAQAIHAMPPSMSAVHANMPISPQA